MKNFERPKFSFVQNTGGMSGKQISELTDAQFEAYMQKDELTKAKRKYRINPDYTLCEIERDHVIMPVGAEPRMADAVLVPDCREVFMWEEFMTARTEEDITVKSILRFGIQPETAREEVHHFVSEALKLGILEEIKE